MDTAQEQRKRKGGAPESTAAVVGVDVFDKVGNDGLKAHVAEARQIVEPEEESVLSLAEAELEAPAVELEEEEQVQLVTAPEAEEKPAVVAAEPAAVAPVAVEEEPAVAVAPEVVPETEVVAEPEVVPEAEVVPAVVAEPVVTGSSDLAKEKALGDDGAQLLKEAVAAAGATLGGGALDDVAMKLVGEQVRDDLEVEEIVEARATGRLDELVQESLRRNALRSRDEVIFLLQQLVHEDGTLQDMLMSPNPGTLAIDIVEYLAVMLTELDDLYALAAYDHGDILAKVVIGDDALNAQKTLSPLALRMGGFSTVLYQLVVDELALHPLPNDPTAVGEQDPTILVDPFGQNLMSLVALFRQFRTASA